MFGFYEGLEMETPVEDKTDRTARLVGEGLLVFGVMVLFFLLLAVWIQKKFPGSGFLGSWGALGTEEAQVTQASMPVANLSVVTNEVRSRRADDVVWGRAEEGRALFERDSVQTMKNAQAIVRFDSDQQITLSENSLVVIKGLSIEKKVKTSFIEVVGGSFRSQVGGGDGAEVRLQVSSPTAVTEVTGKKDQVADFRVDVNPDKTSNIVVFKGVALVNAGGVTVEVKENNGTYVGLSGPPMAPRVLLNPVELDLPADQQRVVYVDGSPEVTWSWTPQEGAATYHLQVATDESFVERVVDEFLTETTFSYQGLELGGYLWRVTAIDADRVEGHWSEARTLHVIKPELQILQPAADQVINQETFWVEGEAAIGARVYLNGEEVTLDDSGRFQKEIPLHLGENLIVLESVDPSGASRFSQRNIRRES